MSNGIISALGRLTGNQGLQEWSNAFDSDEERAQSALSQLQMLQFQNNLLEQKRKAPMQQAELLLKMNELGQLPNQNALAQVNLEKARQDLAANAPPSTNPNGALANLNIPQPNMMQPVQQVGPMPLYQNGQFIKGQKEGYIQARNPDGTGTEIPVPGGTIERGKAQIDSELTKLFDLYDDLDSQGVGVNTDNSIAHNMRAYLSNTGYGQFFAGMKATKAQEIRDQIDAQNQLVAKAYKSSSGTTGGENNAVAEQQAFMSALPSLTNSLQANREIIKGLSSTYGNGALANYRPQGTQPTAVADQYSREADAQRLARLEAKLAAEKRNGTR